MTTISSSMRVECLCIAERRRDRRENYGALLGNTAIPPRTAIAIYLSQVFGRHSRMLKSEALAWWLTGPGYGLHCKLAVIAVSMTV